MYIWNKMVPVPGFKDGSRQHSVVLHDCRTVNGFISEAQDVRSANNTPQLSERGNMVFYLRH